MTGSLKVVYKVNPQRNNVFAFFVTNGCEARQIGLIEMPMDSLLGESVKTADEVAVALRKRIKKSV